MESNLLKIFHIINNARPKELQFSDYRLGEMVRDVCDLFNISKDTKKEETD
jgi:hypothetical protein